MHQFHVLLIHDDFNRLRRDHGGIFIECKQTIPRDSLTLP